jgi:hypothetical protein
MRKVFLALAVLAVAAGCAKENGGNGDTTPKELSLQLVLPTKLETRADNSVSKAGDIAVWVSPTDDASGCSYAFVVNSNGTVIERVKMTAEALVTSHSDDYTKGQWIGEVPSDAKVYVVANILAADENAVKALNTLAEIKAFTKAMTAYTGYTHPLMVNTGATEVGLQATGQNNAHPATGGSNDPNMEDYVAEVTIKPAYARVELLSVQSESKDDAMARYAADNTKMTGWITSYEVTGVYVDDVYYSFNYAAGNEGGAAKVLDPAKAVASDVTAHNAQLAAWVTAGMGISTTKTPEGVGTVADGDPLVTYFTPDADNTDGETEPDGSWGFNVPAGSDGFLVIELSNVKYIRCDDPDLATTPVEHTLSNANPALGTKAYLTVTGYTAASGSTLDANMLAGKVYKLGSAAHNSVFEFTMDHLYDMPNPVDVEAFFQVVVQDWEFEGYNPIFHGNR